jgi:hypothetical protein
MVWQEFDAAYGPAWHCIVGTSFGSYVTHSTGGFLYFSIDKVYILLFRTAVEPLERWQFINFEFLAFLCGYSMLSQLDSYHTFHWPVFMYD